MGVSRFSESTPHSGCSAVVSIPSALRVERNGSRVSDFRDHGIGHPHVRRVQSPTRPLLLLSLPILFSAPRSPERIAYHPTPIPDDLLKLLQHPLPSP
jgi:hypothetical protein